MPNVKCSTEINDQYKNKYTSLWKLNGRSEMRVKIWFYNFMSAIRIFKLLALKRLL